MNNRGLKKNTMWCVVVLVASMLLVGSCIDEDLSKCSSPCTDVTIRYLIAAEEHLDPAFDCKIHSLHAGFWNSSGVLSNEIILGEEDLPDSLIFEITLPADDYKHVVLANCTQDDGTHRLFADDLEQVTFERNVLSADTIRAMSEAVFSGVLEMNLNSQNRTEYVVGLHPLVSRLELTVHVADELSNVRCYVGNTMMGWHVWSSEMMENEQLVTDATGFALESEEHVWFYGFYAFPTSYQPAADSEMNVSGKAKAVDAGDWKLYFLSDYLDNGVKKTVQHVFLLKEPLYAGQVFRGNFALTPSGGTYNDVETGVEVDTDWKPGGNTDVEM